AGALRERPARVEPRDFFPRLHGVAVAMQPGQDHAQLEQGLDLIRIELERAAERFERLLVALVVEQRAPEQQQSRQVVWVLLQHLGRAVLDDRSKSTRLNS